jgi:apolipoprotein N-acyltransferase
VLGGTAWILTCNILVYCCIKPFITISTGMIPRRRILSYTLIVITLPVTISLLIYYSYKEKPDPIDVVVIQPNIDPYNEKFSSMSGHDQVMKMLKLASTVVDSNTDYVIGPETALPFSIWEDGLSGNRDVKTLKEFLEPYPKLQLVAGVSTNKSYGPVAATITARKFTDSPDYYDSYNSVMQINRKGDIQLYHKSKLVIGVEKIPYPKVFGYFEKFAIDLGGAAGSLGTQPEPSVFVSPLHMTIAPAICYESIYGEYMSEYIQKGAQLIFIVTNDGWWFDTPGYRQHLQYARLRAIENRRSIARSANTGISAFINQRGDIIQQTRWWEPAAIRQTINANAGMTLYTKWGDYVGIIASVGCSLMLIITFFYRFFIKKQD